MSRHPVTWEPKTEGPYKSDLRRAMELLTECVDNPDHCVEVEITPLESEFCTFNRFISTRNREGIEVKITITGRPW